LAGIWSYLAEERSELFATRYITRFGSHLRRLQRFPLSGAPRPQLAPGLRVTFREPYAIYYVASEAEITVIRVLHGSRDVDSIAGERGFILKGK